MLKYCVAFIFLGVLSFSSATISNYNDFNQYLEIGQSLDLACGSDSSNITWSFNDDSVYPLASSLNITIITSEDNGSYNSSVTVESVNGAHEGTWKCSDDDGNTKYFVYIEAVITAPDSVELEIGSNLTLSCIFQDDTLEGGTYLTWSKDGESIGTSGGAEPSDSRITLSGDTLNIDNAVYTDAGIYTCTKTYTCTIDSECNSDEDIEVYYGPVILNTVQSVTVPRDDTATLTCNIESYPTATVYWAINGTEITNTSRITITSVTGDSQAVTLEIKDLEDNDRNDYECIATTDYNKDVWTVLLRVKDPLAALWPFLGIVIEVIVLLIIIFIHERRRKGKEAEAEDEDDDVPVSKPVNSGAGEMRMRAVKGEDN